MEQRAALIGLSTCLIFGIVLLMTGECPAHAFPTCQRLSARGVYPLLLTMHAAFFQVSMAIPRHSKTQGSLMREDRHHRRHLRLFRTMKCRCRTTA